MTQWKIGRRLGLKCGHFTDQEILTVDDDIAPIQYYNFLAPWLGKWDAYCPKCNDVKIIIRVNGYLIK